MSAVVTSFPTVYNVRCPPPVIDCLVRNNASVLKLIRTPFYQRNRCPEYIVSIISTNIHVEIYTLSTPWTIYNIYICRRVDIVVNKHEEVVTFSGLPHIVRAAMRVTFNELKKQNIVFLK